MPLSTTILIVVKVLDSQEFFFNYIMKQLKFDFEEKSPFDNYHSETIDEGKNQVMRWHDSLSDDGKKITYGEFIYDTSDYREFENWIDINKKGLGKSAFKWFTMYLKAVKKDRLEKFKRLLRDVEIPFEEGDWDTIDFNRERKDQEKKATKQ